MDKICSNECVVLFKYDQMGLNVLFLQNIAYIVLQKNHPCIMIYSAFDPIDISY